MRLRLFCTIDAKIIITWTDNSKEFYMWSAGLLGDFLVSEQKLFETVSARYDNSCYFPLVAFDDDELAGFFAIRTSGEDNRKVALGYVIIDPNKRNKSCGKQTLN